jgi:hypothetical protein
MYEIASATDVAGRYLQDMSSRVTFEEDYPLHKNDRITHQDLASICKLYLKYGWQVCDGKEKIIMIKDEQTRSLLQRFM